MISFLTSLADRIAKKNLLRHVLFLIAALIAIWISGYHFGTFDQVVHIPFLKKFADPNLYPTDPFLDLRGEHYSFFWLMFIPAYRAGILEIIMFATHVLVTYGLFWMFWELTDTIFHDNLANLLSCCMLIFPHMGLPGFQIIEFSLLNRTFVLPFIIGAIILYLNRRYSLAFLLLGLMANIHIIYVAFVMAMLLFDCSLRFSKVGWKNILKGVFLFILGALPVLIWRSGSSPIDMQIRPDVLHLAASALLANAYYLFLPFPHVWVNTLNGVATLALFIIASRAHLSEHNRAFTNFVLAIGIVLLIQIITTYWLPVTLILQLQILRIGVFLLLFGYLFFTGYLAKRLRQGELKGFSGGLVVVSFITLVTPLIPLLFLALYRWVAKIPWRQWAGAVSILLIQIGLIIGGLISGLWSPGFHIFEPKTLWTQAQDWARNNTSKDAMFITPPQIFLHYVPDWRTFSDRGTVASLVEIFEFPHPDYFPIWQERFEAIAPGAIQKFNGNYFDTFKITGDAFYSLKPEDVLQVARKYNARYLVVEKPHFMPFTIVYQNEGFVIYDLHN